MLPIKLKVTSIVKYTPDVWSFSMTPSLGARPDFVAGQIGILSLEGYGSSYLAFASAPEDPEIEFLVRRGQPTRVAGALFEPVTPATVMLKEIVGQGFPVEKYMGSDLVFVAMGTGLAPLRSALRHVFPMREKFGHLVVVYGARTVDEFCYQEEMAADWRMHGVELRQVISQPSESDWSGPTGYVQSLLDNLIPELNDPVALICGSNEMIEQTKTRLVELGFDAQKIMTNY